MTNEEKGYSEDTLPPHVKFIQMCSAFLRSCGQYTAAKLGMDDQQTDGPKRADQLALIWSRCSRQIHR